MDGCTKAFVTATVRAPPPLSRPPELTPRRTPQSLSNHVNSAHLATAEKAFAGRGPTESTSEVVESFAASLELPLRRNVVASYARRAKAMRLERSGCVLSPFRPRRWLTAAQPHHHLALRGDEASAGAGRRGAGGLC